LYQENGDDEPEMKKVKTGEESDSSGSSSESSNSDNEEEVRKLGLFGFMDGLHMNL